MSENENPEKNQEVKNENINENTENETIEEKAKVEEQPKEESKKESTKKEKKQKPKKSFGRRFLNFIIGMLIYLIIVAVVSFVVFTYLENNKTDETVEETTEESVKTSKEAETTEVTWGETYLAILEDEDNFKNLDDIEVALCDLNQDETPELIVYGTKSDDKIQASIYNINSDGEVDTVKFELKEDFNTELLVDEDEEYEWYIVTESETLYEISLEDEDYEVEKSEESYDDFDVVSQTEKVAYDLTDDDAEDIMGDLENEYETTEEIKKSYSSSSKDKSSSSVKTTSYEGYFAEYLEDYSYDAVSQYSSYNKLYICFLDVDLDGVPELYGYVDSDDNDGYLSKVMCLEYYEGSVIMGELAYTSTTISLVKNDDGEYCYYETEPYISDGIDQSFEITNITKRTREYIVYRPQDITSVPYYYEETSIDNTTASSVEITMDEFEEMREEFEEEYGSKTDLLDDYRIEVDGFSNQDIIDAIPEAYVAYEKLIDTIN